MSTSPPPAAGASTSTRRTVSARTFRRLTAAAVVTQSAIVATGGLVRLTQSGLGCTGWPGCGVADGVHAVIEYGNRLFGTVVGLVALATLVAAHLLPRPRRDLRAPACLLVGGTVLQALLGFLTVRLHLAPVMVVAHFLVSIVLVAVAVTLHHRAAPSYSAGAGWQVRGEVVTLSRVLLGATATVVVLGTLVTGSGPHSGAEPGEGVQRLDLLPLDVISMVHGSAALLVVGLAVANLFLLRVTRAPRGVADRAHVVVGALAAQAAIGVTQYAADLPWGMVWLHMIGATVLWVAVVAYHLGLRAPAAATLPAPAAPADEVQPSPAG